MTTAQRLRRSRQVLAAVALGRAVLWGTLAALLALVVLLGLDLAIGLDHGVRARLTPAPWLAALAVLGWHVAGPLRAALRATDEQLALWFERRVPSLRYALVTQVGLPAASPALERTIVDAPLEREVAAAAKRAFARPVWLVLVLASLVLLLPDGAVRRVVAPAAGDALERAGMGTAAVLDPLATIVVRITPPAYAQLPSQAIDDPATVTALAGSQVVIEGRGRGVSALRGAVRIDAREAEDRWRLGLAVPQAVEALRLVADGHERVLVLEPIPDSVPTVRLAAPARDSVLREGKGTLPLAASLRDDLGLAEGMFELIISAGSGELYTFRTLRAAVRRFGAGVREAELRATVSLDSLALKPGDLIHLRAVAQDRNDVTGPGRGASETRTIRIARPDEYDSVAVDPLPPSEPEKDALSQRMILMQTQELVARIPRIGAEAMARESRRIGMDQAKLRKKVGEIVFIRLEGEDEGEHAHFAGDGHDHAPSGVVNPDDILAAAERAANADPTRNLDTHGDESPIVAINRPLLEAYNHMWRAATELETANPRDAIPWMERAIAALQRARAAERIYLRGRPPQVVVDLARVRLAGKDEARPQGRSPRAPLDPERARRLARFDRALEVIAADAAAAADSLLLLRVTLPEDERGAARALDAAAQALRQGGDVTAPLALARRALVAAPPRATPLGPWGR